MKLNTLERILGFDKVPTLVSPWSLHKSYEASMDGDSDPAGRETPTKGVVEKGARLRLIGKVIVPVLASSSTT